MQDPNSIQRSVAFHLLTTYVIVADGLIHLDKNAVPLTWRYDDMVRDDGVDIHPVGLDYRETVCRHITAK